MVEFSSSAVGESLRDHREASGLTLGQAASRCSIPLTYLLKIEAGSSGLTAAVLDQLIRIYAVPGVEAKHVVEVDERQPQRDDCEIDWVRLVQTAGSRTNREMLDEVATGIRALRGFGSAIPVHMREVEADIFISMLDLSDTHLLVDIMEAFGLSAMQVDEFLAASVRRFERRALPTDSELVGRLRSAPALVYRGVY
jgi:transcriptional regulator with XRE-family HTH domain